MTGKKVDLSLWLYCLCSHSEKNLRKKWNAKGKPLIFVDYCEKIKDYRLFDPNDNGNIIRARDIVFLENRFSIDKTEAVKCCTSISQIKLFDRRNRKYFRG